LCVCRFHKHLQSSVSPLLFDKPWFHNWGKTCCYTHHTFLLGYPTGWSITTHKDVCYTSTSLSAGGHQIFRTELQICGFGRWTKHALYSRGGSWWDEKSPSPHAIHFSHPATTAACLRPLSDPDQAPPPPAMLRPCRKNPSLHAGHCLSHQNWPNRELSW
jgi:hypothetical protein